MLDAASADGPAAVEAPGPAGVACGPAFALPFAGAGFFFPAGFALAFPAAFVVCACFGRGAVFRVASSSGVLTGASPARSPRRSLRRWGRLRGSPERTPPSRVSSSAMYDILPDRTDAHKRRKILPVPALCA